MTQVRVFFLCVCASEQKEQKTFCFGNCSMTEEARFAFTLLFTKCVDFALTPGDARVREKETLSDPSVLVFVCWFL